MNTAFNQLQSENEGDKPVKEEVKLSLVTNSKETPVNRLDERYYGRPVREHVKEFGALFGALGLFLSAFLLWKERELYTVASLIALSFTFVILGYKSPSILRPLWKGWMKFAEYLGIVMSFLILGTVWVSMFVPLGIAFKIAGKKTMDMGFDKDARTYWVDRDPAEDDFQLLTRQY